VPGGAQSVSPLPGWIQVQPAFASVTSVSRWESADALGPEETSGADNWPSSPPCADLTDGIALGTDGDPQAPIASPPITTNKVRARLNTLDMSDLRKKLRFHFGRL
jgi:hypothetical protein